MNVIKEVITLCELILVNPATGEAGERSFSTARRLKTWLRSRMNQERFSNLTVLNIHKERTDRLSTIDIANEFTDRNTNRKRKFGTFQVMMCSNFNIIHLIIFSYRFVKFQSRGNILNE